MTPSCEKSSSGKDCSTEALEDRCRKKVNEPCKPLDRTLEKSPQTEVVQKDVATSSEFRLKPTIGSLSGLSFSNRCSCCKKQKDKCVKHDGCNCEWNEPKPYDHSPRPYHPRSVTIPSLSRRCPRCGGNHHWDVSCPINFNRRMIG